jgi:hypothetical protein
MKEFIIQTTDKRNICYSGFEDTATKEDALHRAMVNHNKHTITNILTREEFEVYVDKLYANK